MRLDSINFDRNISLGIAQYLAPMDTGNLRYNAIRSELTNDGFRITYSLDSAYYIYFLEEGTRHFQGHMGFIGGQTVPAIAGFMHSKYELNDTSRTNHFVHYANKGMNEVANMVMSADDRLKNSLNQDLRAMATQNNWYSERIFDSNDSFKTNMISDYVEIMNERNG